MEYCDIREYAERVPPSIEVALGELQYLLRV